jgi:hypothetical protein
MMNVLSYQIMRSHKGSNLHRLISPACFGWGRSKASEIASEVIPRDGGRRGNNRDVIKRHFRTSGCNTLLDHV